MGYLCWVYALKEWCSYTHNISIYDDDENEHAHTSFYIRNESARNKQHYFVHFAIHEESVEWNVKNFEIFNEETAPEYIWKYKSAAFVISMCGGDGDSGGDDGGRRHPRHNFSVFRLSFSE